MCVHSRFLLIIPLLVVLISCQSPSQQPLLTTDKTNAEKSQIESATINASTTTATKDVKPDPAAELYQQAAEAAASGELDEAISSLQQLIAVDPNYRRAYTRLGLLHLQAENSEEAQKAFENAIVQDSDDAVAYNHLAVIQRAEGRFQEALKNYREALRADPDYANAHLNLGILLDIYLKDLPAALKHYETYLELDQRRQDTVKKWVADIRQRISKSKQQKKI